MCSSKTVLKDRPPQENEKKICFLSGIVKKFGGEEDLARIFLALVSPSIPSLISQHQSRVVCILFGHL